MQGGAPRGRPTNNVAASPTVGGRILQDGGLDSEDEAQSATDTEISQKTDLLGNSRRKSA